MGYTFGQLKAECRKRLWPAGEQDRLHESHEKDFLDAVVNLQRWVPCLKVDHTDIRPHCATFYKCGLTVTDAPQGIIVGVSVVEKVIEKSSGNIVASKVGNMVTASGAIFTSRMVGSQIVFPDGQRFTILAFIDEARVWVLDPDIMTEPVPAGEPQFFYLSSKWRINRSTGNAEQLGEDDKQWHAVEVVGPPGSVQIGPDQTPTQ